MSIEVSKIIRNSIEYKKCIFNGNEWEVSPAGPTLISFTINSTSYQAESGMTWRQWVASDYAPSGLYISGNTIYDSRGWELCGLGGYTDPVVDDPIEDGSSYGWFD